MTEKIHLTDEQNEIIATVDQYTIMLPEPGHLLGLQRATAWHLHKYVEGLTRGSFDLFEILMTKPITTSDWWDELRDNNSAFASINLQKAAGAVIGNLMEQIGRERRWYFTARDGHYSEVWPGEELRFQQFQRNNWWDEVSRSRTNKKYPSGFDIELARSMLTVAFKMNGYYLGRGMTLSRSQELMIENLHEMDYYQLSDYVHGLRYDWGMLDEPDLEWIEGYLRRLYLEVLE